MDKEIKIPSATINAIKSKMQRLLKERDEINDTAPKYPSNKQPVKKTHAGQESLLENRSPRALLPI